MKTRRFTILAVPNSVKSAPRLGALLWLALTLPASATSLQLGFTVPSSFNESNRQAVIEWNAEAAKTYLVQSATNLAAETVWKTEEPVRATAAGPIQWMSPESLSIQKYYRLILPQPEVFSVEPSFVSSDDPAALFYLIGQMLPTNGSVVINGQNFAITAFDPNGSWVALSLNGLPPGEPVFGNIHVLDSGSNVVSTLPLQNPVYYGTELTAEQLQSPPDEPPASPQTGYRVYNKRKFAAQELADRETELATKKGYDYYQAQSQLQSAAFLSKKGYDYYQMQSALADRRAPAAVPRAGGLQHGVFAATGEVVCEQTDLAIRGRGLDFAWTRTYRSRTGANTAQGANWDFSYNVSLTQQPDGTVLLRSGNGRADTFYPNGTNGWARDEWFVEVRDLDSDGFPDVLFADTGRWIFNGNPVSPAYGKLAQIMDRNNNTISLQYDSSGRLEAIVDDLGRTNTIAYHPVGLISSVTDFTGRTVQYEYDGNGDLTAVISPAVTGTPNGNDFPGGKTNHFTYTSGYPNPAQNHLLLTAVDGKGQVQYQHVYQHNQTDLDFLRCISVQRGTNPPTQLTYLPVTPTPANQFRTVTVICNDPVGNVSEISYDSRHRPVAVREFTGRADPASPTTDTANRPTGKLRADDPDYFETAFEWNADSLCTRVVHPRGDSEEMVYERAFNQNTSRSNRSKAADLRVYREIACCDQDDDGDGLVDELRWTFEYDPRFGSPWRSTTAPATQPKSFASKLGGIAKGVAQVGLGVAVRKSRTYGDMKDTDIISRGKGWDGTVKGSTKFEDLDGFVTSATNPRGVLTTAEYDAQGNPTQWTIQVATCGETPPTVDFAYNNHGQLTAITNLADANCYRRVDTISYYTNGSQRGYVEVIIAAALQGGLSLATAFEYDPRGNITRVVDANTNDWLYTYNQLDQLVKTESAAVTDALPAVRIATDYFYDANNNLTRVDHENRDSAGALDPANPAWSSYADYDALDRCALGTHEAAHVVQQGGGVHLRYVTNRFSYDANDNLTLVESPEAVRGADPNNMVSYTYDERDLLFQSTVASGTGLSVTNQWTYNPNGQPVQSDRVYIVKTPRQVVHYNGHGWSSVVTDAMSNSVAYVYDRNGNVTSVRSYGELDDGPGAGGNMLLAESTLVYDGLDRMTFFFSEPVGFSAGRGMHAYAYAPNGQVKSVTDANGHTTRFAYDPLGRLVSVTDPKTNLTSYTYDACGNVLSVTQTDRSDLGGAPQQFTVVHAYDKLHRLTRTVDNVGNTNLYAYDSRANLVRHTDPRGNDTVYEYDGLDRCVATRCYDGASTSGITISTSHVEYDDNDRVVATTDANTNTTTYAYDSLDRCVQVTEADGTHRNLVWSPRSNLVLEQDANGTVISNSFDQLDRCVRRDIFPGPGVAATTTFEEFAYDGLSRLVLASNDVSLSTFLYDSRGNCLSQTQDGLTSTSTYDTVGNCLSLTYPSGRVVTYTYDGLEQVSSMSSGSSGLPPTQLATYSYDGAGRLSRIARANNVNTRYQWNGLLNPANATGDFGFGQVAGINHQVAGGGATIDRRIATFDRNQNRTSRTQTVPFFTGGDTLTNTFDYDALDRLRLAIKTKGTSAQRVDYTLDDNGNRQSVAVDLVPEPYLMDATFPDPADFQMNQYTLTPHGLFEYDANGNRTTRGTAAGQLLYQYDYADRLVAVTDLSSGLPELVVTYDYDALDRQIGKVRISTAQQITHVHVGQQVIEERENGTLKRTYAFPHVFDQKGRIMFTDNGDTLYCHDDDLGNALALTDATGAVVERYEYDDFGAVSFLTSDGFPNATGTSSWDYLYCWGGQRVELETGLHHDGGGDYYDPLVGRAIRGKVKDIKASSSGNSISGKARAPGNTISEINPWSPGGSKAQDHNSSRSNGCGGPQTKAQDHNSSRSNKSSTKAQDHNSSRSNKTASGIDLGWGGGGGSGGSSLIVPVAMDKGLRFGTKAQDHNSSRSNKTASGMAHLHAEGVVHRDIAARNLLLSGGGVVSPGAGIQDRVEVRVDKFHVTETFGPAPAVR